jgi:hypothetical protein
MRAVGTTCDRNAAPSMPRRRTAIDAQNDVLEDPEHEG